MPSSNQRTALSPPSQAAQPELDCTVEGKRRIGQDEALRSRATVVTSSSAVISQPQQVSSDAGSRPSVLQVTPLAHPALVSLKPPRTFPVKAEPPPLHVQTQGIKLTNLEWIPKEASLTAPRESVLNKSAAAASSSICFLASPPTAESCRVPAEPQRKSPLAGPRSTGSTQDFNQEKNKESSLLNAKFFHPLFASGACKWPGCKKIFEEYIQFLKHLHSDHRLDDKGTAQCLIQKEVVQNLEQQLAMEKMRLQAMQAQLTGRLNAHRLCFVKSTEQRERDVAFYPGSIAVSTLPPPHAPLTHQDGFSESFCAVRRHLWDCHHGATLFPDMAHSVEYYKVNTARPPFTYASLISWAILESSEKQLTLSEIYHWFTSRFAYFRHNTATWKNAVRHNLSLHKCFVRVENMKGAVWTVDEMEYQRKRGAKLSRDQEMKRYLSSQLTTNIWPPATFSP
ncbi:forkhead box protein P3 [Rhinatrema bivittatum]|uniref:forkhead box protein P3 n=1 Tax=Rhinatrema bivittatum TaxID=194408 RepID=UPI001125E14B|nr:forkhead box protein P3 [Rhinatrema bivittatum]